MSPTGMTGVLYAEESCQFPTPTTVVLQTLALLISIQLTLNKLLSHCLRPSSHLQDKNVVQWISNIFINKGNFILFFFFCFQGHTKAYGSSQARGQIRAASARLRHSHSNTRSETCLQPTPELTPDPQPTEQGQGSSPHPQRQLDYFLLRHNRNSQDLYPLRRSRHLRSSGTVLIEVHKVFLLLPPPGPLSSPLPCAFSDPPCSPRALQSAE